MDNTSNMKDTGNIIGMDGLPPGWVDTLTQIDSDIKEISRQSYILCNIHLHIYNTNNDIQKQ